MVTDFHETNGIYPGELNFFFSVQKRIEKSTYISQGTKCVSQTSNFQAAVHSGAQ